MNYNWKFSDKLETLHNRMNDIVSRGRERRTTPVLVNRITLKYNKMQEFSAADEKTTTPRMKKTIRALKNSCTNKNVATTQTPRYFQV